MTTSNAGSREIHAGRGGVSVLLVCVFDVNETLLDLAALSAGARRCGDLVHDVRGALSMKKDRHSLLIADPGLSVSAWLRLDGDPHAARPPDVPLRVAVRTRPLNRSDLDRTAVR